MRLRHALVIAALGSLCLVSRAPAAPLDAREYALPNGLRVLLLPDSLAPVVDVAVWYRAGSAWESAAQSGASVLMEQCLNRGPYADRLRRLRERGGTTGNLTTAEYATFWATVTPPGLVEALQLAAARLAPPAITASQLTAAKTAVKNARRDEGALGLSLRALYAIAYPGHPYGAPLAGRAKPREQITVAGLQAWSARYSPGNAVLTVVGAFDTDSIAAQLRRTVGAVKAKTVPAARIDAPRPATAAARAAISAPTPMLLLVSGWRAPAGSDTARVALNVLARLFARGPSSRLGMTLTRGDSAMCATVEGAVALRRQGSMLYLAATIRDAADTTLVLNTLELQGQRLCTEPVSADELERARRAIELQEMGDRQTARGRAFALGSAWAIRGDWREADRDLERLHRVSAADVQAVADRIMRVQNWSAVWTWPGEDAAAGGGAR